MMTAWSTALTGLALRGALQNDGAMFHKGGTSEGDAWKRIGRNGALILA